MKTIILFFCCLVPFIVTAQHYDVSLTELTTKGDVDKKKDHVIDMTKTGWEKEAYIKFTGLATADFALIEVKHNSNNVNMVIGTNNVSTEGFFDLATHVDKEIAFDIFYKGLLVGTIAFEVTSEKGTKVKPKKKDGSNDEDGNEEDSTFQSYIGALASANFVGNNKFLSNLTPVINLGGVLPLVNYGNWFSWELDVNPYVGGDIDTKDSVSFIPALMLYGKGGLILNNYLHFDMGKVRLTVMPFAFGLKFIPNLKDSNNIVIQHNIRWGLALKYSTDFVLSAQLTHGWHNLTSESAKNFKTIFGNTATNIDYITVIGQFRLKGKSEQINNYIFMEWRSLLSKKRYPAFTNNAVLTLGIRKTLELSGGSIFPAASKSKVRRKNSKGHFNL
jgi:hypothetical protein